MRSLTVFIIISLLIHLSSYEGLNAWVSSWVKQNQKPPVTEIELIDQPVTKKSSPTKDRPIVHQLEPDRPVENKKIARFESEKKQRVQLETKARDFGLTKNKSATSTKALSKTDKAPASELGIEPEFVRQVRSATTPSATSKVSIDLPNDIHLSDTTNLNTDANIYYSFYNRVEELYRVRWEERLNYYWFRLSDEFKKNHLAGRVWSTTFEIVLKGSGEYYSASILQSSGYPPFDEAAIFAFKDARYFPNVPKAKVEPDGFVRLRYRFSVHIGP